MRCQSRVESSTRREEDNVMSVRVVEYLYYSHCRWYNHSKYVPMLLIIIIIVQVRTYKPVVVV